MLLQLSINNIVLVDKLDLEFDSGFTVFTGETGAGKSIIMGALSFVLGARSDSNWVGDAGDSAEIIACFENKMQCEALQQKLQDNNIASEDVLIFKRIQNIDGRSRAFLNNKPVPLSFLREIGDNFVEFHSQHADRALVKKSTHLQLLDEFANLEDELSAVKSAYSDWQFKEKFLKQELEKLEKAQQEQDYLESAIAELEKLNIKSGEEQELLERRIELQKYQKIIADILQINEKLESDNSPSSILLDILRRLDRKSDQVEDYIKPLYKYIDEALVALGLLSENINDILSQFNFDPEELEAVEARLFAIRGAARKYKLHCDELPKLRQEITDKLQLIEDAEAKITQAESELKQAKKQYFDRANDLSQKRALAAQELKAQIEQHLPDLKLGHAAFFVNLVKDADNAGSSGIDDAEFYVKTNPQSESGPMLKIASGGELSRFLLALKVVLAHKASAQTLIFDEVDTGVGGAVASAIGEKLVKLAKNFQLIAVTHLPQVAALADHHFLITKQQSAQSDRLYSTVKKLTHTEKIEEIARMLSGKQITNEARATAETLFAQYKE